MLADAVSTASRNAGFSRFAAARRSAAGNAHSGTRESIELARVFEKRSIAAAAHVFENRAHRFLGFVEPSRFARQQRADVFALNDADHSTILLSGYSTMPCAARLLQARE